MAHPLSPLSFCRFLIALTSVFLVTVQWAVVVSDIGTRETEVPDIEAHTASPWPDYRHKLVCWTAALATIPFFFGFFLAFLYRLPFLQVIRGAVLQPLVYWGLLGAMGCGTLLSTVWPRGVKTRALLWAIAGRAGMQGAEARAWRLAVKTGTMSEFLGPKAWTPKGRSQILDHLARVAAQSSLNAQTVNLITAYMEDPETRVGTSAWTRLTASPAGAVRQAAIFAVDRVADSLVTLETVTFSHRPWRRGREPYSGFMTIKTITESRYVLTYRAWRQMNPGITIVGPEALEGYRFTGASQ